MADKTLSVILSGKDELSVKLDAVRRKFDEITESGRPLGKKVREIEKQMLDLSQQGQAGSPLWDKMAEQARQYRAELDRVREATRSIRPPEAGPGPGAGMLSQLEKSFGGLGGMGSLAAQSGLGGVGAALGAMATPAGAAAAGVAAVGKVLVDAGKAASDFETHLAGLRSLTGLSADAMGPIADGALEMSKSFRSSAGDIVDAMKMIGSQAPELLAAPDALMQVTEAANVLSEAAGIDVADAARAITGTMNQMGASSAQATDIINVFAAASQQGAADVAYLNTAFEKAGTMAASSGMDFTQLAAAVETVAPKFSSADVAGSNLSAMLLKLSTQANDQFKPGVVGMSQALKNLADAEMDDAEMKKLVGDSGVVMLKTLIDGREQFDKFSSSLRGTNTAYEQMEVNNSTFEGQMARLSSAWDAFLIQVGSSAWMEGVMTGVEKVLELVGTLIDIISRAMNAFEEAFSSADASVTDFAYGPLDMLKNILEGVGEVMEVVVRLIGKAFNWLQEVVGDAADWISGKWKTLQKTLGDNAFVKGIVDAFNKIVDTAANAINQLKKFWNKLKEWLGMKVEVSADVTTSPADAGGLRNTAEDGGSGSPGRTARTASSGSSGRTGRTARTARTARKPTYEEGSLSDMEARIRAEQKYRSEHRLTAEQYAASAAKLALLLNKRDQLKDAQAGVDRPDLSDPADLSDRPAPADILASVAETPVKPPALNVDPGQVMLLSDSYKELQATLQGLGGEAAAQMAAWQQLGDIMGSSMANGAQKAGAALATVGNTLRQVGGNGALAKAGAIAAAVGQLALSYASALKGAVTPWDWIAMAAAGVGTLASVVATVKGFAGGGIIGGTSFHGDATLARVNAGEMILSRGQQANLFRLLDTGGAASPSLPRQVILRASGEDLVGVIDCYNDRMARV